MKNITTKVAGALVALSAVSGAQAITAVASQQATFPSPSFGLETQVAGMGTVVNFNGASTLAGIGGPGSWSGNAQVVSGSQPGEYAAPAFDTTEYLAVPKDLSDTVKTVSWSGLSTPQNYLGLYWGTLDSYNYMQFFLGGISQGVVVAPSLTAAQLSDVAASTGVSASEIFAVNPNTISTGGSTSYFVDVTGVTFDSVEFSSYKAAFEFDNLALAVPEPGEWALMLAGLGLVGAIARRRKAAAV